MLKEIRARGAVSVACHPHEMSEFYANTYYLWNCRKLVAPLVILGGRVPVDLFPVVSREKLPHCQQRLPPPRAPVRLKTLPGGENDRVGPRRAQEGHRDRRPEIDPYM